MDTNTIKVKVLYFASASEQLGTSEDIMEINNESTLKDLVDEIKEKYSTNAKFLGVLGTSMIALNSEYIYELGKTNLHSNDEVAIIPPISGG